MAIADLFTRPTAVLTARNTLSAPVAPGTHETFGRRPAPVGAGLARGRPPRSGPLGGGVSRVGLAWQVIAPPVDLRRL